MKLVKLVKLVKLISVYLFDIFTSKKAQNPQSFTLLTSKCASRHNGVHFFDTFSTSEPPKVVRNRQFLTLLTSKCASRHNGVHFFDVATSKSGPRMVCFVHFHLEMCFAPQRRALFQHLNFQKWSEAGVFLTFWLRNVLRATTACTFSTSQLAKVVRRWGVLYILTWKCASRHNGVQFFISHLASWLRTRRFSEPTFRPSGAPNHWKNTVFRDFPTFSRICIFFLLIFSLLTLFTSAFQLSILSEVSLLNFLRILTTNHFPVLLRTTKLARTASQYYFVLQSLHEPLPSTTSCCKACANRFPVLLRATKLARTASQYYFVLQSLHEPLPSTTPCYKACTNRFPVRLHSTSLLKLPPPAFHHTMVSILLLYFNFPPLRSTIQWSPFSFFIYTFPPWFPPYHGLHSTSLFKLPPLAFHQTMVSILLLY